MAKELKKSVSFKTEMHNETDKVKDFRNLKVKAEFLFDMKMPFKVTKSGSSYHLESSIWDEKARKKSKLFTPNDLSFINRVRNHIEKTEVDDLFYRNQYSEYDIDYIQVNPKIKKEDTFEDLFCLDISSAYWQTAYMLGIVDKKLYNEGMKMGKVVRLASLGSLAKKRTTWEYDGKYFYRNKPTVSPHSNLWYAICKRVSDVMTKAMLSLGQDFIFYWVDGIYFKNTPENRLKISSLFLDYGYECKPEPIEKIVFNNTEFKVFYIGDNEESATTFSWEVGVTKTSKHKPLTKWIEEQELLELARSIIYGKK
jgi:hypothetical protein